MSDRTLLDLRTLRRRRGWTQSVTADKLGVKVRTLRSWERGSRTPKPIVVRVISDFVRHNS